MAAGKFSALYTIAEVYSIFQAGFHPGFLNFSGATDDSSDTIRIDSIGSITSVAAEKQQQLTK